MFVYSAVANFLFQGGGSSWKSDSLVFSIGPVFDSKSEVLDVIATGSLNAIFNRGAANNAGWAVNSVTATFDPNERRVKVSAKMAVRDSDGYLWRMGFQVTVLAKIAQ